MEAPEIVTRLVHDLGGTLDSMSGPLPDGSGFATASFPLPADHWLTVEGYNYPPMPFRLGTEEMSANILHLPRDRKEFEGMIQAAARYAIRASTNNGKIIDFDPDAMEKNFIIGLLGHYTPNGLSSL